MIETQNKCVDFQIAEGVVANCTIDGDFLHITHSPIVGTQTGTTHFPDSGPTIFRKVVGRHSHFNRTSFICRGVVIGASGHRNRDCSLSFGLGGNCYRVARNAHRSHTRRIGSGRNNTVTGSGNCDGVCFLGGGQLHGSLIQRQTSSGLPNSPNHSFCTGASITPFVVCTGGKGGVIASRIGARGSSSKGHFPGVIPRPRRALRGTIEGKASALGRCRHGSPVNLPCNLFCGLGAITPLIFFLGGEGGRISPGIGAGSHSPKGHGVRIIAVPRRALGLSVIGQNTVLSGNRIDGKSNLGHSFQGRICGILGILRRCHTGFNLPQQIGVGFLVSIVGVYNLFSGALCFIVHSGKLFSGNLPTHQISLVFLPILKVFDTIGIGFHLGINLVHVAILNFNIIKFRSKGFGQPIVCGLIGHQLSTSFLNWSWVWAASWEWVKRPSSAWVL